MRWVLFNIDFGNQNPRTFKLYIKISLAGIFEFDQRESKTKTKIEELKNEFNADQLHLMKLNQE